MVVVVVVVGVVVAVAVVVVVVVVVAVGVAVVVVVAVGVGVAMSSTEVQVKVNCEGQKKQLNNLILNVLTAALQRYGNRDAERAYITYDKNEALGQLRATVTIYHE